MSVIALDFDGTMSRDVETFLEVADLWQKAGFTVYVVTMRFSSEAIDPIVSDRLPIIYTGRKGKKAFMEDRLNIPVTIWVDDNPIFVLMDAYEEASADPNAPYNKWHDDKYEAYRTTKADLAI